MLQMYRLKAVAGGSAVPSTQLDRVNLIDSGSAWPQI